jgi:uncharacterized delta-60 repeat protein
MSKWGFAAWVALAAAVNAAPVQQLWEKRFNGPAAREDVFSALAVDSGGRVYVTGSSDNNVNPDPYGTVKYDTNGNQLWVARYTGPRAIDVPLSVIVDGQGYVYVTGFSHGLASGYDPDYATIKYAPEGTELWVARYNGAGTNNNQTPDNPAGMVVNAAGEVYVTGTSMSLEQTLDFATIKYNTNGTELWIARYNGAAGYTDRASGIGIDAAGNIYVCGSTEKDDYHQRVTLLKYSPAGTLLWETHLDTDETGSDLRPQMKVDPSGNAHIAFTVRSGTTENVQRIVALRYNAAGELVWRTQHRLFHSQYWPSVVAVDLDDGGNMCVAVQAGSVSYHDYLVWKISGSGEPLWTSRYNSPANYQDVPGGMALDAEGNIYVTGTTYLEGNRYQLTTIKLRPNGQREWETTTAHSDNFGMSLSGVRVDSAGHVYVGGSVGPVGTKDYVTIKYRQLAQPGLPQITAHPQGASTIVGGSATFAVTATGENLSYQWRRDGYAIPGATNSTLALTNIGSGAHGYYYVDVFNSAGTVASTEALLDVIVPPEITDHPVSRQVIVGASVEFRVMVTGSEPLSFQWTKDGVAIAGATNVALSIENVQAPSAGIYAIIVTNIAGSTTSTGAVLSLVPGLEQLFAGSFRQSGHAYSSPQFLRVGTDGKAHLAQTLQLPARNEFFTVQFDTNGAATWSTRYAGGTNQNTYTTAAGIDGSSNVYVAGSTGQNSERWMAVVKYGPDGQQLWAVVNDPGRTNTYDDVAAIALDSAGNVYVTGSRADDKPSDFLTVKFDANGVKQWAVRYSVSESSYDSAAAIQVDASGVYVFGQSHYETAKLITLKYDHAGTLLWTRTYDEAYEARPGAMKLDGSGNLIVTGSVTDFDADFITIKYSPAGEVIWLSRYSGMLDGYDYPYALDLDATGNVYVLGESYLPNEENTGLSAYTIVKYDSNGNQLWVASQVAAASAGREDSFAVDDAGNAYLLLAKYRPESGSDLVVSKYDPTGTRLWEAYATRPRYSDEYPGGLAITAEGDLLISGISHNPTSELVLFRYGQSAIVGLPVITQAPPSRDVRLGTSVTFNVTASGALSYQWYFNGRAIAGATTSSYTVVSADEEDAGHYAVEVRNAVGAILSPTAILSIGVPPEITRQPYGQSVLPGTDFVFEVEAIGSRPPSYVWRHNGTNIPGAFSARLELLNVQPENAGLYSVVVSNRAGVATSADALLMVTRQATREWISVYEPGAAAVTIPVGMELQGTNVYVAGNWDGPQPASYLTAKFSSTGEQLWAQKFAPHSSGSYAAALAPDPAGNVYVTGDSAVSAGGRGNVTVKYDAEGNEIWARQFVRTNQSSMGQDIALSHGGSIYVVGSFYGTGPGTLVTIKYDTNGVQLWSSTQMLGANDGIQLCRVAAHGDDVYVIGQSWNQSTGRDVTVIKYNATGTQAWLRRIADAGTQTPVDIKIDPAGDAIVVAHSEGSYTNQGFLTVKYGSADGQELWRRAFSLSDSPNDEPFAMEVDYTRAIYVTGKAFIRSYYDEHGAYHQDEDVLTIKYGPAGDLLWVATYGAPAAYRDVGRSIAWDGDRGLYITGTAANEQGYYDCLTLRYDTDGNRYWSDVYAGADGGHDGGVIARARFNDAYVLGETTSGGYSRLALIHYTDRGLDEVPSIDTPPQGQIVVAGNNVTLSVVASGAGPLRYQWYHDGRPIIGANGSGLLLPRVETTNEGNYFVEVSNDAGVVSSPNARVDVVIPARIVSGPEDQCVVAGSRAEFWIQFEGDCCVGVQWYHNGTPLSNFVNAVRINSAGPTNAGVYSVVVSNAYGAATASARLIVTPQATLAWASRFNSTNSAQDVPQAATIDGSGNTYMVGSAGMGYVTVKFDSSGALLWQRWNVPTNNTSIAVTELALAPDGSAVYVAGWMQGPLDTDHALTMVKYAANGDQLWATNYAREDHPRPVDMKVDVAGNVVITAEAGPDRYVPSEILTVKLDSDGNVLWTARGNWSADTADIPVALALDAAGNVYITGYTVEPEPIEYEQLANYVTVKYNAEGEEVWVAEHSGPGEADDRPSAIAVDGQGNVYVTGKHSHEYWVNSGTTVYFDYDYATIKYDTNGQQLWLAVYGRAPRDSDEAVDLKVDGAGNVYVLGMSDGDIATVKYNAAGQQQWVARLDSGYSYDMAKALVLDGAANAYVTGHSGDFGDILTCKLDANGSRLWLARYDGPSGTYGSFDYPLSIGLDAARNVYVGGSVDSQATSRDFVLLRYSVASSAGSPVITVPPQSTSVDAGSTATLSVTATGQAPLRYQWRRDGVTLAHETNATLQIPAVSGTDAGQYSVVVYNDIDCVVSAEATLTVVMPGAVQCVHVEQVGAATRLTIAGPAACTYQVECSADMVSWHTLGTVYNSTGTCQYADETPRTERRFYRVLKLPY